MSLYLFEIVPAETAKESVETVIRSVTEALRAAHAEVVESQVTAGRQRVFVVVEADAPEGLEDAVRSAVGEAATQLTGPDEVRLVGADLEDIKKARQTAGYLVEWDIPAEIDMDTYLARKKANAPKYADVPEVSFLRTYVREDTVKCLCFYDAPDEAAVRHARDVVSTPVDRLHRLS